MSPEVKTAAELSSIFTVRVLAMYPLSMVSLVRVEPLGYGRWRATTYSSDTASEIMADMMEILQAMKVQYVLG